MTRTIAWNQSQFRVVKDDILQRTRAYNCAHLVEFISVKYQNHTMKLLDVAHSKKPLLKTDARKVSDYIKYYYYIIRIRIPCYLIGSKVSITISLKF